MKKSPRDVNPISRWHDRPEGGAADEDRAAALTREAVPLDASLDGLDDRQLLNIEERLKTAPRARPPYWLRPALVAALLTASVTSVLGYETGWFAPLRARLWFRSIPSAAPEPVEPPKKRVLHSPAAPTHDEPPARADIPVPAAEATEGAQPRASVPPLPRAAVTRSPGAAALRKIALADDLPPTPPLAVAERAEPIGPSEEIQALGRAMELLRGKHDAAAALAALNDYGARFPSGVLAREARVARVDALLMLDRADEALRALEELPLDEHRRSTELQLIRGELRARTDCEAGEADFTAVLARVRTAALEERALYGRAACRSKQGNVAGAANDLRQYVDRFPNGPHADWARRWLQNNR